MTSLRSIPAALLMAAIVSSPIAAQPRSGPFSAMAGSWSGGGTLTTSDGNSERLRCRATYSPAGNELRLNIRCASQSYNIDLGSEVAFQDGRISGTWTEAGRNASGSLSGRATSDHIEAAATSQNFSASLSLSTKGNKQSVSIRSNGGDIAGVSLALSRN
ncbi:hypothetical protein [Bradyrhizobium sp. LHD-71]|uniref:hypothetical protein n=1 Tax=Bradyrhizobium sp. LHD-71 TaxID=3072141 RepID=UPI00280FAD9D|nr:hypothetical protein [Bradyrhizobium sp. LHD-71]MDQ8728119.1 hypothetical protein [Bradyrhizobium sp. LHD-71]